MRARNDQHALTERDYHILRWMGRHGVVSVAQVWRRHFLPTSTAHSLDTSSAYRRVRALEEMGLIRREQAWWRGPDILLLTPRGARVADVGLRAAMYVPTQVEHALAVVDLIDRILADETTPVAQVTTEREIHARRRRAQRTDEDVPSYSRTPDAIVHLASGETVAVELDRTPKRDKDIRRICELYNAHFTPAKGTDGLFNRVWWYAHAGRAAERVQSIVDAEGLAFFIEVRPWTA